MIIEENINSPLYMPDKGIKWEIDWGFTSVAAAGRIEVTVLFWNEINGERKNKESRNLYIITGAVDKSVAFSLNMIEQLFFQQHPYLNLNE